MIVVTAFLPILNRMEYHLVQNWNKKYHHDHIPSNLKENVFFFLVLTMYKCMHVYIIYMYDPIDPSIDKVFVKIQ